MFYLEKDIDIKDVKLQSSEVEFVKYMTETEINQLIDNEQIIKSHGIILKKIKELEFTNENRIYIK